jgi:hypothetical protein
MTCTTQQIIRLKQMSHKYNQVIAAAKSGMSTRAARKYLSTNKLPSETVKNRHWKTRTNVFEENWLEIEDMLSKSPKLQAKTILEHLISQDTTNKFNIKHERTLQRLIRNWHASNGEDKAVIFHQQLKPGKQSQSDYTVMNEVGVSISGQPFNHMLFHFMLPYSRWEYASICYSESFESLSKAYDDAVWSLGFVAFEHRTDNLTAATQACGSKRIFTKRWQEVMDHYGVVASRNNPGVSHENGSVEKSHDLLKNAIRQQLMLRGSSDFADIASYQSFINKLIISRNSRRIERFDEELTYLKPLPSKKYYAPIIIDVNVSQFSTVRLLKTSYSVPSRLIGYSLRAYIYQGEIKLYYGQTLVQIMPQLLNSKGLNGKKEASINYRHIITSLLRKPGAFANYYYREYLFPTNIFRTAYDMLIKNYPVTGVKQYLQILQLAAIGNERDVETALELLIDNKVTISFVEVQELLKSSVKPVEVKVITPSLEEYDSLLTQVA